MPVLARADPMLPARYYARLGVMLAEQGVSLEALIRRARLSARKLTDPDGLLGLAEVERLARAAWALSTDRDLGWRLGASLAPGEHATLGHVLLQAPTLDVALQWAARYFALLSPGFVLRYRPGLQQGEVTVMPRLPFGHEALRLHLDVILTALLAELAFLHGGDLPPLEVDSALPAPAPVRRQPLLRVHRCRFGLGGLPRLQLRFPGALLRAPRPRAGQSGLSGARRRLEAEREALLRRGGLGDWAAMMLREAEGGMPGQAELAGLMGLSTRSFSRALEREGVGFRALSQGVRMARARAALMDGTTSITGLALSLGYRDVANFSRAFRAAHGCSPAQWRRKASR